MVDAETAVEEGSDGVAEYGVTQYARMSVIGGSLAALAYALASAILNIGSAFLAPVRAFANGMATFITGTFGAPVIVTDAGARAAAASFVDGAAASLGPFAFPLAVLVSVAGMYIFLVFLRRISISPTQLIRRRQG